MKVSAIAHANIALVKYWGKRDTALNLPAVGSISMTLAALYTETSVEFHTDMPADQLILNSQRAGGSDEQRVSHFLDRVRARAGISRYARVVSYNNFPTGAGLASSASGFAALALAASHAAGLELSADQLSELARLGSGSAARSIYGGFVEMARGTLEDGSDAIAHQLYDESYWPLEMLIVITSSKSKDIGSTEGMVRTAETAPYFQSWVDSSEQDLDDMRAAIAAKDFDKLGDIAEFSCLKMHGLMMAARPGIIYWNDLTLRLVHLVRQMRRKGIGAYFTIDGGPQVKIICEPGSAGRISAEVQQLEGVTRVIHSSIGPAARIVD